MKLTSRIVLIAVLALSASAFPGEPLPMAWAGGGADPNAPAVHVDPKVIESGLLAKIKMLKASTADHLPNDPLPRRFRLEEALSALADFYDSADRLKEADRLYAELVPMLSKENSEITATSYLAYAQGRARQYMRRRDWPQAKKYIDLAIQLTQTRPRMKNNFPDAMTVLADWNLAQKQYKEAESALLEGLKFQEHQYPKQPLNDNPGAYLTEVKLIQLYLDTNQLQKAETMIAQAQQYRGASSLLEFLHAKVLRGQGKAVEAGILELQARQHSQKEQELRRQQE